jgi:hypothetical protein
LAAYKNLVDFNFSYLKRQLFGPIRQNWLLTNEIQKWRASQNQWSLFPKGGKVMPALKGVSYTFGRLRSKVTAYAEMKIAIPDKIKQFIRTLKVMYHSKHHHRVVKHKSFKKVFSRWDTIRAHTWQHRLFCLYNDELSILMRSYEYSKQYTYSHLATDGAKWTSLAKNFFNGSNDNILTIRKWSDTFNEFENWTMLNCTMALSSYFETYLASVIRLALESDPGAMIGKPHTVDGMELIKHGKQNIKTLETIRVLRNRVGHAFGRDIKKSREIDIAVKPSIERLSRQRFNKWQKHISMIVSDIDTLLLKNHIGSFQQMLVYHKLYPTLDQTNTPLEKGNRMMAFKKVIGTDKKDTYSKDFCRSLVAYYERL